MANKIAKKLSRNYDDQQDIVSNCILKLWKYLDKKGYSPGIAYEYTIMYSGGIDWIRKQKKYKKIKIVDLNEGLQYGKLDIEIENIELFSVLESYKEDIEDYDLLLELLKFENPKDVAEQRNKSANAARVEIHRKRKNWKEVYEEISSANGTSNSENSL